MISPNAENLGPITNPLSVTSVSCHVKDYSSSKRIKIAGQSQGIRILSVDLKSLQLPRVAQNLDFDSRGTSSSQNRF